MIDCLNVARYFIMRAYEDGVEAESFNDPIVLIHPTPFLVVFF